VDRDRVIRAIRASWVLATSSDPERWSLDNPAIGQCEVSSYVAREYLGGNLVLARVLIDGEEAEHHYWNRLDSGEDIDLTIEQFSGGEELVEMMEVDQEFLDAQGRLEPRVAQRIATFRSDVQRRLSDPSSPTVLS
jgi:hypothetical protein